MGLLAAVIKLVMSILDGNLSVYVSELFPTIYRGIACSLVSIISKIGSISAPFIAEILT